MKKIISTVIAAAVLTAATFALDFAVSADLGIPVLGVINSDSSSVGSIASAKVTSESVAAGFGFDLEGDVFFNKIIGVGVNVALEWPISMDTTVTTSGTVMGNSGSSTSKKTTTDLNSGDVSSFTFNLLMGPAIRPVNTNKMVLIIVPGIDVGAFVMTASEVETSHVYGGIGANVRFGYKLNKNIALDASVFMAYNFTSTTETKYKGNSTKGKDDTFTPFLFTPKLGATYFF